MEDKSLRPTARTALPLLAVLSAALVFGPAPSASSAETWAGKTVMISVGYKPGGGADTMARLLAVHMPKHLPGNPQVLVANRPGGGTTTNARDMLRRPTDGTHIGQFAQALMVAGSLGRAPSWFNWAEYNYLGMVDGAGEETFNAVCGRTDKMKNLDDFLAGKNWRWGEISPATGAGNDLTWFTLTKFPIRAFFGYGGSAEVAAAFDRGEMDVTSRCTETEAARYPQWFSENKVIPLFGWGQLNPDKHVPPNNPISNGLREGRYPWFGDMRTKLRHLATDDQWNAFNALFSLHGTHVWALPPKVPAATVKAMRKAFWDTINSKAYIADMNKRGRIVAPLSGEDTAKRVKAIQDLSPTAKAVLSKIYKQKKRKKKRKKKKKSS